MTRCISSSVMAVVRCADIGAIVDRSKTPNIMEVRGPTTGAGAKVEVERKSWKE